MARLRRFSFETKLTTAPGLQLFLEYVAGDARHKGKGIGYTVCAAVTRSLVDRGYSRIFLTTDDWRLPAIAVYFKLGYVPDLYLPEMQERLGERESDDKAVIP